MMYCMEEESDHAVREENASSSRSHYQPEGGSGVQGAKGTGKQQNGGGTSKGAIGVRSGHHAGHRSASASDWRDSMSSFYTEAESRIMSVDLATYFPRDGIDVGDGVRPQARGNIIKLSTSVTGKAGHTGTGTRLGGVSASVSRSSVESDASVEYLAPGGYQIGGPGPSSMSPHARKYQRPTITFPPVPEEPTYSRWGSVASSRDDFGTQAQAPTATIMSNTAWAQSGSLAPTPGLVSMCSSHGSSYVNVHDAAMVEMENSTSVARTSVGGGSGGGTVVATVPGRSSSGTLSAPLSPPTGSASSAPSVHLVGAHVDWDILQLGGRWQEAVGERAERRRLRAQNAFKRGNRLLHSEGGEVGFMQGTTSTPYGYRNGMPVAGSHPFGWDDGQAHRVSVSHTGSAPAIAGAAGMTAGSEVAFLPVQATVSATSTAMGGAVVGHSVQSHSVVNTSTAVAVAGAGVSVHPTSPSAALRGVFRRDFATIDHPGFASHTKQLVTHPVHPHPASIHVTAAVAAAHAAADHSEGGLAVHDHDFPATESTGSSLTKDLGSFVGVVGGPAFSTLTVVSAHLHGSSGGVGTSTVGRPTLVTTSSGNLVAQLVSPVDGRPALPSPTDSDSSLPPSCTHMSRTDASIPQLTPSVSEVHTSGGCLGGLCSRSLSQPRPSPQAHTIAALHATGRGNGNGSAGSGGNAYRVRVAPAPLPPTTATTMPLDV